MESLMSSSYSHPAGDSPANPAQFFMPPSGIGGDAFAGFRESFPEIIGNCPPLLQALDTVAKVAKTNSPVLVLGESGTGKELIASALHRLSPRANRRLVAINCSAIPEDLLEAELFGHEKGAFTGADRRRQGHFETAAGGTLFLDEIGEMPLRLQAKLLRVLQEKRFSPLGSDEVKLADVRIIAATNSDLEKAVLDKSFRLDLYYRLHVVPIVLPPLRDRGSDLDQLIAHFLDLANRVHSPERSCYLTQATLEKIRSYSWPGNVRQLQNLLDRLVILRSPDGAIHPDSLPQEFRNLGPSGIETKAAPLPASAPAANATVSPRPVTEGGPAAPAHLGLTPMFTLTESGVDLVKLIGDLENTLIVQALEMTKNNKNQAARLLGLNRTTLVERIKKRGISSLNRPSRDTASAAEEPGDDLP
jgi:sigma-54 dependent transcriptional regulator, flagellar regulatory protein